MTVIKKNYNKIVITYLVFIIFFALDQVTKQSVISNMPIDIFVDTQKYTSYPAHEIFPWLWINHVVNFGAAWSLLYGQRALLLTFALVVFIGIIYYEFTSRQTRTKTLSAALGFILAGMGNAVDRLRLGYVTDFLEFRNSSGQNVFPIFNIADISIDVGIILLLIYVIFQEGKNKPSIDRPIIN